MSKILKEFKRFCVYLVLILSFWLCNVDAVFAHTPHDVIELLEISPNYDQDKTLFIVVRNNLLRSIDAGYSWKRIIKGLDNKFIFSSLATSSHSHSSLYLASNGDGIYRSEDGGNSWSKANKGLDSLNIALLHVCEDYSAGRFILATGTQKGVYKTKDGGGSWYQVIDDIKITAIASSPENKNYIIISDKKGILYVSTNGGDTWKHHSQISNSGAVTAIAVSPNFSIDGTFFVGTEKNGIFKTVDRGISFVKVNNGISDNYITSIVLSPKYKIDSTLFVSTWHEAVFRSNDGGNNWEKYSKNITHDSQAATYKLPDFKDLKISKTFGKDKTIFLGGFDGLFKSTDSGRIWKQMDTLSLRLIIGLALSPNYENDSTVAITTYVGGAYITHDRGMTWTAINKGLKKKRLGDLVFSPNYRLDKTIFTVADNYIVKSPDGGKTWNRIKVNNDWELDKIINFWNKLLKWLPKQINNFVGTASFYSHHPTTIAISPNFITDQTIYFGTRIGNIFRSIDGGKKGSTVWKEVNGQVTSLAISPNFLYDKTLYAGVSQGEGIYKTVNGGATWQPASNGLVVSSKKGINLAVSPYYKVDKTVFAGTIDGLFKTIDAGKSWVKLPGAAYNGDSYSYIQAIAISPNYQSDKTFIISVRGRGLFKTVNNGETFSPVAKELINSNHSLANMELFPPAAVPIKFSPSYLFDNTIYGSSAEEIFKSTDGGNTWETITIPIRYKEKRSNIAERLVELISDIARNLLIPILAASIGLGVYYFFKRKPKHLKQSE